MRSGSRDKRYLGPVLRIDLMDAVQETRRWSAERLTVELAPLALQHGGVLEGRTLTGVFTFADHKLHGVFEATLARPDVAMPDAASNAADGLAALDFTWISERGHRLLRTVAGEREPPTMKVSFTHGTANWSLSGFLVENYHGALKSGERFRGMIWLDKPQDPGLFGAHAIKVDSLRHTLAVKFDEIPANTFSLLEAAIKKTRAAPSGLSAPA